MILKELRTRSTLLAVFTACAFTLAGCSGEDGAQGIPGEQGPQGPQGIPGSPGVPGAPGTDTDSGSGVYTTSNFEMPTDAIYVADVYNDLTGTVLQDGADITEALVTATFGLTTDDTVVLPKGRYLVNDSIVIFDADRITLTGYGINETQLDFSGSLSDDAIRFEGGNTITVRDFSVYESPKNAIKASKVNGIHFNYTGTIWEGPLESDNGAYGVYPVQSSNIIVENNYAYGSADAGIYVGQSENIVVRNNVAKNNVAGIEIENSSYADVYNNVAIGNTGGILIFDLPGLEKAYGKNIRVFNNQMIANNAENVGNGAVGIVPPGTGALIYATSDVEMYNNVFKDNETISIALTSYFVGDSDFAKYTPSATFPEGENGSYVETMIDGWSPYIKNIYVHNNEIERSGANPRGALLEQVITPLLPDVNMITGFTETTSLAALGVISDRAGETMPAILYDGVGEFVISQGMMSGFDQILAVMNPDAVADGVSYQPYTTEDAICVSNNLDTNSFASSQEFTQTNIGMVFATDEVDLVPLIAGGLWDPTSGDLPPPLFITENFHGNTARLYCTQTRLEAAVATFDNKAFGCKGDDLADPACSF